MMCDFGTGNNNKLNWVLEDKQELVDILETIYRGAKKGRGLVVSPKGKFYSLIGIKICIQMLTVSCRLLHQIPILIACLELGIDLHLRRVIPLLISELYV